MRPPHQPVPKLPLPPPPNSSNRPGGVGHHNRGGVTLAGKVMRADFGRALQRARRHGYAFPVFNFDNLAVLQAIIAGAEAERAPVIVMATEGAVRHLGVDQVIAMATVARRQARVPVLFHFDHGQSLDLARYFVDHGADSVMLDWFLRSVAANTTGTQQLVRYAHQRRGVRGSGRPCGGGQRGRP